MTTIFISHASTDDDFANKLKAELHMRGYRTWVDHFDIPPGARWVDVIEQALRQCDVMILVLSQEARKSRYVQTEWHAFYENDKLIIPARIGTCTKPMLLSLLQDVDFTNPKKYEERLDSLFEVLPEPTPDLEGVELEVEQTSMHTIPFRPQAIEEVLRITQTVMASQEEKEKHQIEIHEREVLLVFPDAKQSQVYRTDEPLIIGRSHETVSTKPDVDLSVFGAAEKGVSRRHAMLVNTSIGLTITDLGSRNGTFVGEERLDAHQSAHLENRSIVRFGGVTVQIHFKEPAKNR